MESYENTDYIDDIFDLVLKEKYEGDPATICRKLRAPMIYWQSRRVGMAVGLVCLFSIIASAITIFEHFHCGI